MRLAALSLTRFGHFTDFWLDLQRGDDSDFHIILGPNEAGKSTIVEGWLNLLYGIPARTNYAFRHERDTLQVSARIDDGAEIHTLTRLRKASNSLVGPDGAPLPEAILTGLLRGIGEDAYRHLYCLDDKTIEKGGEDILASKGDLGQLLFSAASGLSAFNDMLEIERATDRTFHIPRGQGRRGTRLYKLSQDLRELDARIRETDLTAPEYRRLREEVMLAQSAEAEAKASQTALIAEDQSLRARRKALPILTERNTLRETLAELGPQPVLAEAIAVEMGGLAGRREGCLATIRTRQADIDGWKEEREKLEIDPRADGLADALAALAPLRSRALNAEEDLPRRTEERDDIGKEIANLLVATGLGGTDPARLGLSVPALDRLDRATQAQARALQRHADAQRELTTAEKTLAQHRETMPAPAAQETDPDAMEALLRKNDANRTAEALATARRQHEEIAVKAWRAIAKLSIGGRTFTTPGPVPLTSEGAEDLATIIESLADRRATLEDRLAEDDRHVSALSADIATLQAQGAAPTDQDAAALREARDRLWTEHRATLSPETADAYARARGEDDLSGALRLAEAARLAELRRVERDHARAAAERDTRARQRDGATQSHEAAQARLAGILADIGLPDGLVATDLAVWLRAHGEAVAAVAARDEAHAALAAAETLAKPVAERLAAALGTEPADLTQLVAEAQHKLIQARAQTDLRAAAMKALRAAEAALKTRQTELTAAATALGEARADLSDAIGAFDFTLPEGVHATDALPRLRAVLSECDKRAALDDRIAKMTASASDFAAQIASVAAPWPELADKPALEQAAALDRLAASHRRATERRRDLDEDLARAETAIRRAEADRKRIDDRAGEIALAWDSTSRPDGFAAIAASIRAAEAAADIRQRIATCERALLSALESDTLDKAEAMLAGETENDLETRLSLLAPELKQAAEVRDAAIRRLSIAEKALGEVSGDSGAARLAQDRRLLIEEIRNEAEVGLRRRIGLLLAERGLGRYRDRHRGAMLAATEAAFVVLTGGVYSALSAQRDGNQETLIVHRASDGRSLRADEETMSKGTRFQLYFALRLAGYRQMAEAGTILPFVCDDIFETFDEDRTAAACRLMQEIGHVGQALYFTHHAHVAEIATRECPGVQVHRLHPEVLANLMMNRKA